MGLSETSVDEIHRARTFCQVVSVQNRYNLVDREWEPVVDYCEREGIGFLPWSPLQAGAVAGVRRLARSALRLLDRKNALVMRIAKRHRAAPAQIALAWLLSRSVMLPIPGTSKAGHLEENIRAAGIRLSSDEITALR